MVDIATPAHAHAFLVSSTPENGQRLAASPPEIVLRFSEPAVRGSQQISVRSAGGHVVRIAPLVLENGGLGVRAGVPALGDAVYLLSWHTQSIDGHESAGELAFAVGTTSVRLPVLDQRSATIPVAETIATAVFLGGVALALGGVASERFVWQRVTSTDGVFVPRAPVVFGLAAATVGAAGQVLLLARSSPSGGTVLDTRAGVLTAVELLAVAYALWILRSDSLRSWAGVPMLAAIAAAAFRGHSGATDDWWSAPTNALHFAFAGVWVGALAHLVLVLRRLPPDERRPSMARSAHRYANLALAAVLPLLVFGVITALGQIHHLNELVDSRYGQVLLIKVALVATALAVALTARVRGLPAGREQLPRLARLTRIEVSVLALVIVASGVLVNVAPPGPENEAGATLLGPAPLRGDVIRTADLAGQLEVLLSASAGGLRVETLAPGAESLPDVHLHLEGRRPNGSTFTLYPRPCGASCAAMAISWTDGTTGLDVRATARGWRGGTTSLSIHWPPGPDATPMLDQVVAVMRAQPSLDVREEVTSGPTGNPTPNAATLTGEDFLAQELYAAGGATDVRALPEENGLQGLSLFVPGSTNWIRLWFDDSLRLRRELIVNPGHRIQRTFDYP